MSSHFLPILVPSLLALLEADGRPEEPLHLLAEAVGVASLAPPARVEPEVSHEGGERRAQFQPAAAGADGLGRHPEQQQSRQRAVRIAEDQFFWWSQPGRMESVRKPLLRFQTGTSPGSACGRVTWTTCRAMNARSWSLTCGSWRIASGRVEDAVAAWASSRSLAGGIEQSRGCRPLHAILGFAAFFKEVVDRLAQQFLDVRLFVECDLLELAGGGGVEESGDGLLALVGRECAALIASRRQPGALAGSALPLAWRRASLRLERFDMFTIPPVYTSTCKAVGFRWPPSLPARAPELSALR